MDVLRTPEARFKALSGYDFSPNYLEIRAFDGTPLRIHYLDEGPKDAPAILCMHGQPSWSFLYRKMVPLLVGGGYRVIAPDLIGFGRSDKPAQEKDYSYQSHVDWMTAWMRCLDLKGLTLVCQDWGGLIGLRMVANDPARFNRLVISNTGLPDSSMVPDEVSQMLADAYPGVPVPDAEMVLRKFGEGAPDAFLYWIKYAAESPTFSVRDVFAKLSNMSDPAVLDGYAAPFPDARFIAGARRFPSLVPLMPHHKRDREANDAAWDVLGHFERPVLTAFSDRDPVTRGGEKPFQSRIPGAKGRRHVTIEGGGHFLQEDSAEAFSDTILQFIRETSDLT